MNFKGDLKKGTLYHLKKSEIYIMKIQFHGSDYCEVVISMNEKIQLHFPVKRVAKSVQLNSCIPQIRDLEPYRREGTTFIIRLSLVKLKREINNSD
ncbi:unnamed protein product [Paramecium sonneborni]|uniref:Uncharacterized protein n=1 Tax=Paramecium sonneborni TaxID=65129 RepID=A0A8S1QZG8_9CILI|nr:unnamed protein product [Paramecium sonneborni]